MKSFYSRTTESCSIVRITAVVSIAVLLFAGVLSGCSKPADTNAPNKQSTESSSTVDGSAEPTSAATPTPLATNEGANSEDVASGSNDTANTSKNTEDKAGKQGSQETSKDATQKNSSKSSSKSPTKKKNPTSKKSAPSSSPKRSGPSGSSGGGSSQESSNLSVTITIDGSAGGGSVSPSGKQLTLSKGASVYDALKATGAVVAARTTPMGTYVYSINSLAEKQQGGKSGWEYSVNGVTPSKSCSLYTLSDGDVVVWRYKK